jgi:hypothetical protein
MHKGPREKKERNSAIIRLHKNGISAADVAVQFDISPGRVSAIINRLAPVERRRCKLREKYGDRPNIERLPDRTPIDALLLCDPEIPGWTARVGGLAHTSVHLRTLGDLRHMRDAELLAEPRIGVRVLAELRSFCPFRASARTARQARKGQMGICTSALPTSDVRASRPQATRDYTRCRYDSHVVARMQRAYIIAEPAEKRRSRSVPVATYNWLLLRRAGRSDMTQAFALVLAAIGGAFVHAALLSKGILSFPQLEASTYYLTVAFIAFVNAGLCASARNEVE